MPASIIRPPCTRYQSECRLTDWRIASRIAWAAASSDMVMVRLHSTDVHQKIPTRESAVLGTLTRLMMTGLNNVNSSNDRAGPDHDLQPHLLTTVGPLAEMGSIESRRGTAHATSSEGQVAKRENS